MRNQLKENRAIKFVEILKLNIPHLWLMNVFSVIAVIKWSEYLQRLLYIAYRFLQADHT